MGYTAKGGNQAIPEAMAAALKNEVHLNRAVIAIRSNSDGAEVHCSDGRIYRADRVICSVPFLRAQTGPDRSDTDRRPGDGGQYAGITAYQSGAYGRQGSLSGKMTA